MKRTKNKLVKHKVIEAITGSYGIKTNIAKRVGCTRRALYYFLDKTENKDLRELIDEEKETLLDLAEHNLIKALKSKDKNERKWSTMFFLNTYGAKRGYGNKNDNTNRNYDIPNIMKELENMLPYSLIYIERLARGEDIGLVYPDFKYYMANHRISSIHENKEN